VEVLQHCDRGDTGAEKGAADDLEVALAPIVAPQTIRAEVLKQAVHNLPDLTVGVDAGRAIEKLGSAHKEATLRAAGVDAHVVAGEAAGDDRDAAVWIDAVLRLRAVGERRVLEVHRAIDGNNKVCVGDRTPLNHEIIRIGESRDQTAAKGAGGHPQA
jgi:hypothetical protein